MQSATQVQNKDDVATVPVATGTIEVKVEPKEDEDPPDFADADDEVETK